MSDLRASDQVLVDVVTVTYNSPALADGFAAFTGAPFRLLVIDNASDRPPTVPSGADLVRSERNDGFGAACNRITELGSAPYVLFLNPDCEVAPETVLELADRLGRQAPGGGIIGPRTTGHPGQRVLPAGWEPRARTMLAQYLGLGRLRAGSTFNAYARTVDEATIDVDWVGGGCMLVDRGLFLRLGGFSPTFFMYGEDVDLCLRARDVGAPVLLAGDLAASHPVGTGSTATTDLRMAWLRNLRTIVRARSGPAAQRRFDAVLRLGGCQASLLRLLGKQPSLGRPDLPMLERHVFRGR